MGEQLQSLVNVTIHYPDGRPRFRDLLCGRLRQVAVCFEEQAIPQEFLGRSYDQDQAHRQRFQQWVNRLWEDKDALLGRLHRQFPPRAD
ncbi:putative acyltransferase YihG [compost metagenome]